MSASLVQVPLINPPALVYNIPNASPIINRSVVKIPPSNGSSFQKNSRIIVDIPANGWLDAQNTYVSFHSAIDDGTAANKKFQVGGLSWCRRLRISSGRNETIEDIQDYAAIEHMMRNLTYHDDYVNNHGEILAGYGNIAANLNNFAAGKQNNVHLNLSGVFNNTKYWPLLITDGLRLEFFLDGIDQVSNNSSNDSTNYTIKFFNLVCDFVDVNEGYMRAFMEAVRSDGIRVHIPTYLATNSTVSASQENVKITEAVRSIKSVWGTLRETAALSSQTENSYETRQYDMTSYQYRFGNKYIPQQEVQAGGDGTQTNEGAGGAEVLSELLKSLNAHGGVDTGSQLNLTTTGVTGFSDSRDGGADGSDKSSKEFIFGVNMELDPNNSLSGLDGNRRILDLTLKFADAPTSALTLSSYIYYDQVVMIDSNSLHVIF